MSGFLGALGALLAAVVATVILGRIWPSGVSSVDFFLMVVVYYAISRARVQGIWMGAVCGLTQDVLSSQMLGFNAFVKTAVGYLVGGLGSKFILNQPFPQFLALMLASVLDALLGLLLTVMLGVPSRPGVGQILRRALLTSLIGLILFRFANRRWAESRRSLRG